MKITTPKGILEGDSIEAILKKYGTACLLGADLRHAELCGANLSGLTVAQLYIMQDYLHVLFDRIKVMGISLDSDDVEPEEKPLPPEPQSHGFFIPRDGSPYLILHDTDGEWSCVTNTPAVMCEINGWSQLDYGINKFSGYLNWEQLVEDLQDSAFPLIPLSASSMPTIAKAFADND